MEFKCKTGKIGVHDLMVASVVNGMMQRQSMRCIVTNMRPMKFELKNNLPEVMAKRLFADRIPSVLPGYIGSIQENYLVVEKDAAEPTDD